MKKEAVISTCGQYRYSLSRTWDESKPTIMFIMLNPSKADDDRDDPTLTRCLGFAKDWGYGKLLVGNFFAYRSTDPKNLRTAEDPVGPDNIPHLQVMINEAESVILAFGNFPFLQKYLKLHPDYEPLANCREKLWFLGVCKNGLPRHPLMLKKCATRERCEDPEAMIRVKPAN